MHLDHSAFSNGAIELKSADEGGDDLANDIVTKALADLTASVETRIAAIETKADEPMARLAKLEAKLNRPAVHRTDDTGSLEIETKALEAFYRSGSDVELKALTTTNGTTGVMAPAQLSTTILERIREFSPVRQLATVMNATSGMVSIPRLVSDVEPEDVNETTPDPRPSAEPEFEQIDIKSHEMSVFVPLSRRSLEDANVDLAGFIANNLVAKFSQREGAWFVKGNGTTQAEGILTSAEIGEVEAAGATVAADDLIDLFYSLKTGYSNRGAWLMNRKTMAAIRKLEDGDGTRLWEKALTAGQPATILGRPVYEASDMPDIAAGASPILFGDYSSGYLITDRIAFEPLREDLARSPIVHIGARRRVGGSVVMGEAIAKLVLA